MTSTAMTPLEAYRETMGGTPAERVRVALETAGPEPMVLGFDANGIQAMISASRRPIAMEGASDLLVRFDRARLDDRRTVFAGGGRGLMLVARDEVESRARELRESFSSKTCGGVLATAWAPFQADRPDASLRMLRLEMGIAKDGASPPREPLARANAYVCEDCRVRPRARRVPMGNDAYEACERCAEAVEAGRARRKRRTEMGSEVLSLEELAEEGQIAVVSADGNDLGTFFESLHDLPGLAAGSFVVGWIVEAAQRRAIQRVKEQQEARARARRDSKPSARWVDPVTGGDDVRVLLPPSSLLVYVDALLGAVDDLASRVDDMGGALREEQVSRLRSLKLGLGALVAPAHFDVVRLVGGAHDLERDAKRACRQREKKDHGVAYAYVTTGDAIDYEEKPGERFKSVAMDFAAWRRKVESARGLRALPYSQLGATLRPKSELSDAEATNLFRYQVTRHPAWQTWIDAQHPDVPGAWRDPARCAPDTIDRTLLDLLRLVRSEPDARRGGEG